MRTGERSLYENFERTDARGYWICIDAGGDGSDHSGAGILRMRIRAASYAVACLAIVFASLTLQHYYPSTAAYGLVAWTSGMVLAVFVFKRLWSGLQSDWLGLSLVGLVFLVAVVLPIVQYVLQAPSLFISAMVFGGLVVGVFKGRLPETIERSEADLS